MRPALTLNKKLAGAFGGLVAIGATVALTAGTFSYFSDSNSQQAGEIRFGTLDLVPQEGAAEQQFDVTAAAAPGDVVLERTDFSFRNAGTMDGELRIRFVPTHAAGTTGAQAEAFDDFVLITLSGVPGFDDGKAYTLDEVATETARGIHLTTLTHGDDDHAIKGFPVTVTIDPKAGNILQGVEGGFKIVADLVQSGADGRSLEYPAPSFPAAPVTQP
jgi:hypothetical protein